MSLGRVVAEKFALLQELGRGGMGAVYVAEHLVLRSKVAIKLIDATLLDSPESCERFTREARAAAALRSPHVVQILDHGVDRGIPYIVMELLEGENLAARLARQKRLPARDVLTIMQHLGKAMTRAHAAGIVHRDLKPDNVFMVEEGEEFFVKVLDFGVAKALNEADIEFGPFRTENGSFLGSPPYTSPEQISGGSVDARSDLWAMAVLSFECLTGQRPFTARTWDELMAKICREAVPVPSSVAPVPDGYDAWFLRATQRDPAQRFQSARELVKSLADVLAPAIDGAARAPNGSASEAQAAGQAELVAAPATAEPFREPQRAERRAEVRRPSSVPAGIDGARDFRHLALIQNVSRSGALLGTRIGCEIGRELTLNIPGKQPDSEQNVRARVVRVQRRSPEHGQIWHYDVGVEFLVALPSRLLDALERPLPGT